jgi:uncharacterized membrane protein (UPF0127 family)
MDSKVFSLALLLFLLLAGCAGTETPNAAYAKITFANGNPVTAEIARTAEARSRGLMYRESLCGNCGMLFVFESSQKHSFWMKNTKIPLEMIFISENHTIVDIIENVPPCPMRALQCPSYTPSAPAYFVLEVNAGVAKENGLKRGDELGIQFEGKGI